MNCVCIYAVFFINISYVSREQNSCVRFWTVYAFDDDLSSTRCMAVMADLICTLQPFCNFKISHSVIDALCTVSEQLLAWASVSIPVLVG